MIKLVGDGNLTNPSIGMGMSTVPLEYATHWPYVIRVYGFSCRAIKTDLLAARYVKSIACAFCGGVTGNTIVELCSTTTAAKDLANIIA